MSRTASKLRDQVAFEAARLLLAGGITDVNEARERAARRIIRGAPKRQHLPSLSEVRTHLELLAMRREDTESERELYVARLEVMSLVLALRHLHPLISGGVLDGEARFGGVTMIQIQASEEADTNLEMVKGLLTQSQIAFTGEPGGTIKVDGAAPCTIAFRHGDAAESGRWIDDAAFLDLIEEEYPWVETGAFLAPVNAQDAPTGLTHHHELLLRALEDVKLDPRSHPEGDALYHSLQVFDLVCREEPYDRELLEAALLHQIDPALIEGTISERTSFFITHLADARAEIRGDLGERTRRQLRDTGEFEALLLLARAELRGRAAGVAAPNLEEALDYLRELSDYENEDADENLDENQEKSR